MGDGLQIVGWRITRILFKLLYIDVTMHVNTVPRIFDAWVTITLPQVSRTRWVSQYLKTTLGWVSKLPIFIKAMNINGLES